MNDYNSSHYLIQKLMERVTSMADLFVHVRKKVTV